MAIVTDRTVTRGGLSIGISKNITQLMSDNEFTVENLTPFMFAGQLDRISNRGYSTSSSYSQGPAAQQIASGVSPLIPRTSIDAAVFAGWRGSMGENTEFYGRNILLYTDYSWSGTNQHLRSDDTMSNMYVVTDVDIKKLYFNTGNTSSTINAVTGDVSSATYRNISGAEVLNRDNDQSVAIAVYTILIDGNDNWYLYRPDVFPYNERTISNYRLSSGWDSAPTAFHKEGNVGDGCVSIPNPLPDFETHTNYLVNYASDGTDFEIDPDLLADYGSGTSYFIYSTSDAAYTIFLYTPYAWGSRCVEKDEDVFIQQLANVGLYFKYDNTMYKPLASGGFLDGYTTDMTEESDWDDITNVTGNTVPVTPPGPTPPTPSGDDMDTMATGATGSSGGFTHFYIMSPQDLIDLLADFYTRADPGETLSNNLVCSYILGIPSSEFCATENVAVAIHNSAQGTPFVSQDNYAHVTATNNLLVVGNFDVPRMTNTFYDFSPYSTYEVFIPCCGWVALPDTVAGRKIYVEMYIDIASCCVKAGVKISGEGVCAVANGVLGASIPMAVIESGILRGNNIQAGLGIIGGGINTGISAGNGNALGIGFGVQQILGGLIDCTVAGNTNYTQQKGGTGDITQFAMGHECYLKVTHPELDPVVNESIFGHSVGYLCNSIGKLETFKGFTVCGNPHVTFSASAEERDEIERLLSIGVIL